MTMKTKDGNMGFYNFIMSGKTLKDILQKDNLQADNKQEKKEEDRKSKQCIGAGIKLDESVRGSTAKANQKFYKPDYNSQTRKQYYDDPGAHKRAMDKAFSNGDGVTDPYTGARLTKSQSEAKSLFGKNWQNNAGEADHIDPLSDFVNRHRNNSFISKEDLKDIGNQQDNFQVLSRKLNQGSKDVGKGGSTQEEWAADPERMKGVADNIQSGESAESVRGRIKEEGKAARKRNDKRVAQKSVENVASTAHDAGIKGAYNAGSMTLTMSGIMNIVAVIKGEKNSKEAIKDTIEESGKAALTGYGIGGGLTVIDNILCGSSSEFMKFLGDSNVPGRIITAVMITGDTLKQWSEGKITTQECIIQLGDKGLNMATIGYSMAAGQALVPIPVVGAAVGALVGSMLTSNLYNQVIDDLNRRQYEHEERMRRIAECNYIAEQTRAYRLELQNYLDAYFEEYKNCFDTALSSMRIAFETGDADGVIMSANQITRKLGGSVKYENMDEFKEFLDSDEVDVF